MGDPKRAPPKVTLTCIICASLMMAIYLILVVLAWQFFIPNIPPSTRIDIAPAKDGFLSQTSQLAPGHPKSDGTGELNVINHIVKERLKQLDTVIVNCPVNDSREDTVIQEEFLEHLAIIHTFAMENNTSAPTKVWLRLNPEDERDYSFPTSTCTEMAEIGKRRYPEIMEGVVGNSDVLELPAAAKWLASRGEQKSFLYKFLQKLAIRYNLDDYPKKINSFHDRNLKFAFMMNPKNCFVFAMVPESITSKFDELFYWFEEGRTYTSIVDNILVTVSSNNFDECRDFVAAKAPLAPQVRSIKSQAYVSYDNFLGIFSV